MKFAIIALIACASVALVSAHGGIMEREGHLLDMRIRLGHFKHQPFIDLYKQYATAFVYPEHKHERTKDDYRNYMPSGDECMVFFKDFRVNKYQVNDFEELVVLDACLGYLFDSDDHELDTQTDPSIKDHLVTLKSDTNLHDLYHNTKINEITPPAKGCVADLLLNNILAKHQYRNEECNNHYLQMYLQFAECQSGVIAPETRADDSYLKIVYDTLRARVQTCFSIEIDNISAALRLAYTNDRARRAKLVFKSLYDKLSVQQNKNMWPTPIVTLLAAVQDTKTEINLRQVHQLVRGYYTNDQQLMDLFLHNIGLYATETLEPKPTDKYNAKQIQERYRDLIDEKCRFFRSSDSESNYDYATPLIRMVELLNHQDLFELTPLQFVTSMITRARETAPVYFGVSACNLLTFTEASIPRPSKNTKQVYKIAFMPDAREKMIKWPDAGYF